MSGLELLTLAREIDPTLPVILVTGHGDIAMAVQAMKAGAYDFVEKPFSSDYFTGVVQRALEKRRLTFEVHELRRKLEDRQGIERVLIGNSAGIEDLRRTILKLGDSCPDVLIVGETGTGKELVARCLHEHSRVRDRRFVAVNCGAIPETMFESEVFGHEAGAFTGAQKRRIGKLEYAAGGTLLLDEVESLPLSMQVKLLRALQQRQVERLGSNDPIDVEVRVVASTKTDLAALCDEQKFRRDLYYRLNVVSLEIPPLRERREDIPILFEHFVLQAAQRYRREAPMAPGPARPPVDGARVAGQRPRASERRRPLRAGRAGETFRARRDGNRGAGERLGRAGRRVRAQRDRRSAAAAPGQRRFRERGFGDAQEDPLRQDPQIRDQPGLVPLAAAKSDQALALT